MVEIKDQKSRKYDRQIRIWGAHGQAALESAEICLLNCGPTGSETLKNLVLGGIAGFTVVDASKVEPRDLGNNFMLSQADLGQSKAQVVSATLKELNDTVSSGFIEDDPEKLIDEKPQFLKGFALVIATQLREASLIKLDAICRQEGVKLLAARSFGLMASLRIIAAEHAVIETKPDSAVSNLRFHAPWKELKDLAMSFNLADMDEITHKHLPFAILLIQAVQHWAAQHQGKLPAGSKERNEFKALLRSWQRNIDGVPVEEENFNEAITNASKIWSQHGIPSDVQAILQDDCINVTKSSNNFWCLAAALKHFIEKEGQGLLPLEGSLPDMHATTELYLQIQRVYQAKADADVNAVEQHLRSIQKEIGASTSNITRADIKLFCKNARHLRLVRFRSLEEEFHSSQMHQVLKSALTAEDTATNATLYILLRAVDRFYDAYRRYPGTFDSPPESDIPLLKTKANALLTEIGASPSPAWDDCLAEICRFGAGELHCVAAIVGGIAAQEAIKLLTKQFVPQSGTIIYNATGSTTSVFSF